MLPDVLKPKETDGGCSAGKRRGVEHTAWRKGYDKTFSIEGEFDFFRDLKPSYSD